MELNVYQPRQYLFNGSSILLDQYADVNVNMGRFDQTFEDAVNDPSNSVVRSQYQSQNNDISQSAYINQPHIQNNSEAIQNINVNQQPYPHNPGQEFREDRPEKFNLVPQELLEALKTEHLKKIGYEQKDPEMLYKQFQEYRKLDTRRKIKNPQIIELLKYSDADVYYSLKKLQEEYKKYIEAALEKQLNKTKRKPNKKNKRNCDDFKGFFKNLVIAYSDKYGKPTNDYKKLMKFWRDLKEERQKQKGIQWENGEKDLETEMAVFLSDGSLIERLRKKYKKMTGQDTKCAETLFYYWERLPEEKRYHNGLYTHDQNGLRKLLCNGLL